MYKPHRIYELFLNEFTFMMKTVILTKRHYTNKDLILDHFGRLYHLPAQLVENGLKIKVICANYRSRQEEIFSYSGLKFHSIPLSFTSSIIFLLKSWKHVYKFNPDAIFASGDSHFGFIGVLFSRLLGIPCIYDLYDDYTAFGSNRMPFMKSVFKWTVRHSNSVICASSPLIKKISRYNKNVTLIVNGVDEEVFKPISKLEARDRLEIPREETVIGYFGSIEQNYGIEILSDSVLELKKKYPRIKLLIAGKNDAKVPLSLPHIDYRGPVPQTEIPLFINASDVVVIPYLPDPQINMSSPCKLPEYLACSVPIVSTRVSDIPNTLSVTPQALCKPDDRDDMIRAIRWQLKNRKVVPLPENLSWKKLGLKLYNLLNAISDH